MPLLHFLSFNKFYLAVPKQLYRQNRAGYWGVIFSISPNPAHSNLTLNFGDEPLKRVRLVNVMGQVLLNEGKNDRQPTVLDVSFLPSGLYLLETDFGGKKGRIQKVVIEK